MSNEYLYNYGNGNYAHQEVVVLLVFDDEKGNKYIEEGALRVLQGYDKMSEYVGKDGFSFITSDVQLLKKQVPNGLEYKKEVKPDLSKEYPYDFKTGMYKVTDEELRFLIINFEKMYPSLRVEIDLKHIDELTNDNSINKIEKRMYPSENYDINTSDLEMNQMFKDQILNKKDDTYDDENNIIK